MKRRLFEISLLNINVRSEPPSKTSIRKDGIDLACAYVSHVYLHYYQHLPLSSVPIMSDEGMLKKSASPLVAASSPLHLCPRPLRCRVFHSNDGPVRSFGFCNTCIFGMSSFPTSGDGNRRYDFYGYDFDKVVNCSFKEMLSFFFCLRC